jgi:hypothetical protein
VSADEQEAALAALPEMMMRAGGGAGVMSWAVPRPRSSIPATQFHSQARGGRVQLLVVDDDTVNHQVRLRGGGGGPLPAVAARM